MTYNPPKSAAGYCKLHKWRLSFKQIKVKGCVNQRKQRGGKEKCRWFVKYQHPAWAEKEVIRERKRGGVSEVQTLRRGGS